MLKLNLLPQHILDRQRIKRLIPVLVGLLLLEVVAVIGWILNTNRALDEVTAEAAKLKTYADALAAEQGRAANLRAQIQPLRDKTKFMKDLETFNAQWASLMEGINKYIYSRSKLDDISITPTTVSMSLQTETTDDVGKFILNVKRCPLFVPDSVTVSAGGAWGGGGGGAGGGMMGRPGGGPGGMMGGGGGPGMMGGGPGGMMGGGGGPGMMGGAAGGMMGGGGGPGMMGMGGAAGGMMRAGSPFGQGAGARSGQQAQRSYVSLTVSAQLLKPIQLPTLGGGAAGAGGGGMGGPMGGGAMGGPMGGGAMGGPMGGGAPAGGGGSTASAGGSQASGGGGLGGLAGRRNAAAGAEE